MAVEKIIFDLGRVLVKFNVRNLFRKIITTEEEIDYFLQNICTWEWHIQQDLVQDTSQVSAPLVQQFPKYQEAIEAFYGRFLEMIEGTYEKNVKLAMDLKQKGYPIYVLSNFPGDQYDKYEKHNSFLQIFDDKIISGHVGLAKPDTKIYQFAIDKFHLIPERSLFIDDKIENIEGAKQLGIQTIHLQNPDELPELIKPFIA
jgi:2-haloacid dehalogenase